MEQWVPVASKRLMEYRAGEVCGIADRAALLLYVQPEAAAKKNEVTSGVQWDKRQSML